jgi:hypothetical protein
VSRITRGLAEQRSCHHDLSVAAAWDALWEGQHQASDGITTVGAHVYAALAVVTAHRANLRAQQ